MIRKRSPRGWWSNLGHPRGHGVNNRSSKKSFTSPVESSNTHRQNVVKALIRKTFSTGLVEHFRAFFGATSNNNVVRQMVYTFPNCSPRSQNQRKVVPNSCPTNGLDMDITVIRRTRAGPEQPQSSSRAGPEQAQSSPRAGPEQPTEAPEQPSSSRTVPEQSQRGPRAGPERP